MDPAGAHLDLRAVYGGAQIVVPAEWAVELGALGLMGGAGDARPKLERPADAPLLSIGGFAVMGGIGVTSERPEGMRSRNAAVADVIVDT